MLLTSREKVQSLTLCGKTASQICAETGLGRHVVCKYREEMGAKECKAHSTKVRDGFWDEWEYAVYILFGGHKNVRMEP